MSFAPLQSKSGNRVLSGGGPGLPSKLTIGVFGVGYVGVVAAACFARDGHDVVAVDTNRAKLDALTAGRSPVVELGVSELVEAAVREGRLTVASSAAGALRAADVSLICVGTPARDDGSFDDSFLRRAAAEIGAALAGKQSFHSVVVRSTVLPGTTEETVIPILESHSGKRAGIDFGVGYFPDFTREGSAVADHDNPGTVVFGALDTTTASILHSLNSRHRVVPKQIPIGTAEMLKYVSNAWHAAKISFANEVGRISKSSGIDGQEVMEILCSDGKLNVSDAYMTPGFAFGGPCLSKDIDALRHFARSLGVETPMLNGVLRTNALQVEAACAAVEAAGGHRVGIIGLAFKPGVDDLRSSPYVDLVERLIAKGYTVRIFDPIVRLSRLTGANKAFVTDRLPHIAEILVESPDAVLSECDVVVVGNRETAAPFVRQLEERGVKIVDLVRLDRARRTGGNYDGICW